MQLERVIFHSIEMNDKARRLSQLLDSGVEHVRRDAIRRFVRSRRRVFTIFGDWLTN